MYPAYVFPLIICFLGILAPTISIAASFDCTKAATKVEKMICGNGWLSKMDEEMGKAYFDLINKSQNPDPLIRDQRAWLKDRNKCTNKHCLRRRYEYRIDILNFFSSLKQSGSSPLNNVVSVDCAKASTMGDQLVCKDPELLELDKKLVWAYSEVGKLNTDAAISTLKFLRSRYEPSWREDHTTPKRKGYSDSGLEKFNKRSLVQGYKNQIRRLMLVIGIIDPFNELDPTQKKNAQKYIALLNDDDWLTGIWLGFENVEDILIDKVDGDYIVKSHDDRFSTTTNWVGKIVRHDDYVELWYYQAIGIELSLGSEPDCSLHVKEDQYGPYLEESNECKEGRKCCTKYRFESNEISLITELSKVEFTTGENDIRNQIKREKNIRQQRDEYTNRLDANQKQTVQEYMVLLDDDDWLTGIWTEPTPWPESILIEKVDGNYTVKSHYDKSSIITNWVGKVVKHDDYVELWYYSIKNGELVLPALPTRVLYLKTDNKSTEIVETVDCLGGQKCVNSYSLADRDSLVYYVNDEFSTGEGYLRNEIERGKKLRKNGSEHYDLLMGSKSIKALDGDKIYDLRVVKEIIQENNKYILLFLESGEIAHSGHCGSSTDEGYYWFKLNSDENGQWKIVDEWGKKNNSCMTNSGWKGYEKDNNYYLSLNDYLNNYETLDCFYFDLISPEKGIQICPIGDQSKGYDG